MQSVANNLADFISEQEYLDGEKVSDIRHEYIGGQVFAMAGSSKRHNRISGNLYRFLIAGGDCDVYLADIKVRLQRRKTYYYPDVVVSCEDEADSEYYLDSPCLLVEVLSRSTWRKDYQEKLLAYQAIPTLKTYLVVSQDKVNVDCFHKDEEGYWWVNHLKQLDDVLELDCPQMQLSLHDIYDGISFNADSAGNE